MQLPVFEPSIPNNTIKIEITGMFHNLLSSGSNNENVRLYQVVHHFPVLCRCLIVFSLRQEHHHLGTNSIFNIFYFQVTFYLF